MPAAETPRALLGALELPRTMLEMGSLAASAAYLQLVARGDGHPVIVLPGYTASDESTRLLRQYLSSIGYDARPWNLGRNLGLREAGAFDALHGELERIAERTGKRASLIGWSLGGVHARNLAKRAPRHVRQVISLGSPLGGSQPHADIPSTAIYSRTDGVVAWRLAMEEPSAFTDNIEVYGSHCGLGFNPAVYYAIADRLSQPEGRFERFHRAGWRAAVYGPAELH
ncbi:MAG TPA: alpha/beta fold hydrolase [Pseudomonadales bacterium]|nr:alpha/beta fold hydrolase [Pseudomonadales bacterium]